LLAIKQASKEALDELRSTLHVLRSDADRQAPRTPTRTLGRLDELVDRTEAAGLPVEVVIDGPARPLPASIELAAFRIVQESLTNVLRHAGDASAEVRLTYGRDLLTIEVRDAGTGPPGADLEVGHGIAGMRERAVAIGGDLEAGAGPAGGFRVRVRLPLTEEET
jgi:signal transduction histidine kinase